MGLVSLRALFVAALLAAPPAPNQPAGTVVAVSGTATATGSDQVARPLAVGAVVRGEDLIATSKGGSISVRLEFNHVVWTLRGGLKRRVSESVAWTASSAVKGDPLFSNVPDATGLAAGRDATNGAAQSAAALSRSNTSSDDAKRELAPEPPPPVAPGANAPAGGESASGGGSTSGLSREADSGTSQGGKAGWFDWLHPAKKSAPAATASAREKTAKDETAPVRAEPAATAAASTANAQVASVEPSRAEAPKPKGGAGAGAGAGAPAGKVVAENKPVSPAPEARRPVRSAASVTWTIESAGGRNTKALDAAFGKLRAKFASALPSGGTVVVRLVVGADGTVSDIAVLEASGAAPEVIDAVTNALGELRLGKSASPATIRLQLER